jgi:diguanylate cyclase (GGDEF)-like protein
MMLESTLHFLTKQSKFSYIGFGFILMLLLGVTDYLTGYELSFALFYLIPVTYTAWYAGLISGLIASVLCAAVWQGANYLAGETHSHVAIYYWNAAIRFGFFFAFTHLIVRLRNSIEQEKQLSHMDYLTGTLNSRAFYEILEREILRTRRYLKPFTIAYLDLDNFKYVNDHFGHSTGDVLLKTVAHTTTMNLRSTDVIARLGGDEFAILLPETDSDSARTILPKLRQLLLDMMAQRSWSVTFSIGAITLHRPPEKADQVIKMADDLMYKVKEAGKNQIEFGSDEG